MAVEVSIFEKYDAAIAAYFSAFYAAMYPTLDVQVLIATPDRQFADYTSKKVVDQKMLKLPRVAIFSGGTTGDPKRHNPTMLRKFAVSTDGRGYQRVRFPTAVNISYQVGFWTDKVHQSNRWKARLHKEFHSGYRPKYFRVTVGDGWGEKIVPVFLEGVSNNSNIEPQEESRIVRLDATLRLEGWVFDQPDIDTATGVQAGERVPVVLQVETTICDMDGTELDKSYEPKGGQ